MSSGDTPSSAQPKTQLLPPLKMGNSDDSSEPATSSNEKQQPPKKSEYPSPGRQQPSIRRRFLTPAEWAVIAHGIGGLTDQEDHRPVHPTSWYWPPKGLPDGLYKDVVLQRTKYWYVYHVLSIVRLVGMTLQLFIGAILTALGSMSKENGTAITILAAANTIQAGILALMHNSGLPDRYRSNREELQEVEDYLKEILDTGLVPSDQPLDHILADCFDRYQLARKTVTENVPSNYTASAWFRARGSTSSLQMSLPHSPAPATENPRQLSPRLEKGMRERS
jgi:SMODS and SLOG-associating 2TM effector domain